MAANHYLLDRIEGIFENTKWKTITQGTELQVQNSSIPELLTTVSVVPASITIPQLRCPEASLGEIKDVIQVKTQMPFQINKMLNDEHGAVILGNKLAGTGSLHRESGEYFVVTRATIYEGEHEDVVGQTVSFLLNSITFDYETIAQGLAIVAGRGDTPGDVGGSAWTSSDLKNTYENLRNICVCTYDDTGITAEFPIVPGATSAAVGDQDTALLRIRTDVLHPYWGAGLFCALEFPYRLGGDGFSLHGSLNRLNGHEFYWHDRPPHYGACADEKTPVLTGGKWWRRRESNP